MEIILPLKTIISVTILCVIGDGLLYPKETKTRELKDLSGLWYFVAERPNSLGDGFRNKWFMEDISLFENSTVVPVPCSYNDISQSKLLTTFVGWVWYQKDFHYPSRWSDKRIILRFESVRYFASVWVNGHFVMNHTGGHLPFEEEVNGFLNGNGMRNRITVAVNSTLSHSTIPQADFKYTKKPGVYPDGWFEMHLLFGFFNYAGIDRRVVVYTRPKVYIDDIAITTNIDRSIGVVNYCMRTKPVDAGSVRVVVTLTDRKGKRISQNFTKDGQLVVPNAVFWWPIGMHRIIGYLYRLEVCLSATTINDSIEDYYDLNVGIRTVSWSNTRFYINSKPFYFKGFGMHEDSDIRGKGFDWVLLEKDFNLLDWFGANSFRTSHYPYAEERIMEADKRGIVVIGEMSAVGLRYFTTEVNNLHQQLLREMIERDKNHPSIVMWSIANEPEVSQSISRPYFRKIIDLSKSLDSTRPVTIVTATHRDLDKTADMVDINCINRYYGWYDEIGHTELIPKLLINELTMFHQKFNKPIIHSEYGAETITGMNTDPPVAYTESYQVELLRQTQKAFDMLRSQFLIGELLWNFADFLLPADNGLWFPNGCRKGVLTRQRQPKMGAWELSFRYRNMNATIS